MISVVYVTCRPVVCVGNYHADSTNKQLTWIPEAEPNQYTLLARSLRVQTHQAFELVCVDEANEVPRPELADLGDRVTYVRPRETPWHALNAFAPAIARNTGTLAAHGEVIVALDDCVSFGPQVLAEVASRTSRGIFPVLHDRDAEAGKIQPLHDVQRFRAGGLLAYPRATALALGGVEERFVGAKALEDWEFSERLVRAGGVRLVSTPATWVQLQGHRKHDRSLYRCCRLVRELVSGQTRANEAWTPDQLAAFGDVCRFDGGLKTQGSLTVRMCAITGSTCDFPQPTPGAALAIMRSYESRPFSPFSAP